MSLGSDQLTQGVISVLFQEGLDLMAAASSKEKLWIYSP